MAAVIKDAGQVEIVAQKAMTYIQVAEQVGKAWGLSGADKLGLVKDALLADLAQVDKPLADLVTAEWPKIAGILSALVSVFNFIGWAFAAAAPIVAAADPGAAPAINAINAAIAAVQAVKAAANGGQSDQQPQPAAEQKAA
ncbi:MAG TPA: hypothetical protein VFB02_13990 [Bradyrhizobium sp.]|nr:hypothetical protein [Bradyrhizobium sp.]